MEYFNNNEQEFKALLSNLDLDIDSDQIWDKVEHRLPKSNDNYRLPWAFWMIAGSVLVFTFGLTINAYNLKKETLNSNSLTNISDTSQSNQTSTISDLQGVTAYEAAIDRVYNQEQNSDLNNEGNSPNTLIQKTTDLTKSHTIATNIYSSSKEVFNQSTTLSRLISEASQQLGANENEINVNTSVAKTSTSLISNDVVTTKKVKHEHPIITRSIGNLTSLRNIWEEELKLASNNVLIPTAPAFSKNIEVIVPPSTWVPFVSLYAGGILERADYSAGGMEDLNTSRLKDETSLPGYTAALSIGIENRSGLRLLAGLRSANTFHRYIDNQLGVTIDTEPGVPTSYINAAGQVTEEQGNLQVNTITQNHLVWHRRHHGLDLILGVGKRFQLTPKLSFVTDLGVNYNILTNSKGYQFNERLDGVEFLGANLDHGYKTKGAISGFINTGFQMKLSDRFELGLKGSYNKGFNTSTINSHFLSIKNSQISLQIGGSYRLDWE